MRNTEPFPETEDGINQLIDELVNNGYLVQREVGGDREREIALTGKGMQVSKALNVAAKLPDLYG